MKNKSNSHVIYMYTVYGIHAYLGKGKTEKRAYDLRGHKHCIPAEVPHKLIDVHIVANNLTGDQASLIENEMIREVGLRGVWNNINGMTPDKARKLANDILNRPIAKKGFMTVPTVLVNEIINHITIEKGDEILIPADKNANFHSKIRETGIEKQIDLLDSDIGSRSLHGEVKGTTLIIDGDFLEHKFGKKYKLIVMNPPWTKYGTQFIDKAVELLEDDGKLVCIISNNQFARTPSKDGPNPGTFMDLHKRGNFLRIETYSGSAQFGSRGGAFKNKADWVWFIWEKSSPKQFQTTIVNRYSEEFKYTLDRNEYLIPQLPNERELFDYENGIKWSSIDSKASRSQDVLRFKWTQSGGYEISPLKSGKKNNLTTINILPIDVDPIKLKIFLGSIGPSRMKALYINSTRGGTYKFPPIRKELII